jgi:tRNA threonylcarbamoyl adenosine modification protein YeaZ
MGGGWIFSARMGAMLLAFEATTRAGSAGLFPAVGEPVGFTVCAEGRAAAELPRVVHELIETHGRPQALAVATGPGSFTGLRVAAVLARSLAWCEGLRIHPVCTMRAIAAANGLGEWLVVMPLKRDVTFVAAFAVSEVGITELLPITAHEDSAESPVSVPGMTVVGPALEAKPALIERWFPANARGSAAACDARGVAAAAPFVPAQAWDAVTPAYHMASAPELQRERERRNGVA